jgi:hypothetical protein
MLRGSIRPAWLVLLAPLLVSATPGSKKSADLEWALFDQPAVVTLVNLHPDPARHKLSSVNYQLMGLIPVCTPVKLVALKRKELLFQIEESGVQYVYEFHKTLQGAPQAHLDKVFGPPKSCPEKKIAKMSKADREGIKQGRVAPGMTKTGVTIAIGYPPEHATPTLDMDEWRYWRNRFNTMLVMFKDGKVTRTQE